jgi:two-component system response regulator DevR
MEGVVTRIFVVENHPSLRERLREFLEAMQGVEYVGDAATPDGVIDGINATRPDLVLLNFQLDGGTGLDVLRAVRQRTDGIVFVVLTQHTVPQYRRACLEAGAHYFFDKTNDLAKIRRVIAERGAVGE